MKILIVEDDRRIASFLARGLTAEGYEVDTEYDGRDGLERLRTENFDLVILDRMLPYLSGTEVCKILREENMPIMVVMLTAKDTLQDKIDGLRGGADDYLTKPFAFDELLARLVALQRRGGREQPKALRVGPIVLDPTAHRVTRDGTQITLTLREFELLRYLMSNAGKVLSRERLLSAVWGYGHDPGTKIVDVYVRYLRQKIDPPNGASAIHTVRGIGYMISGPSTPPS